MPYGTNVVVCGVSSLTLIVSITPHISDPLSQIHSTASISVAHGTSIIPVRYIHTHTHTRAHAHTHTAVTF